MKTFNELLGKTLVSVTVNNLNNEITFTTDSRLECVLFHNQDCCESVTIESINGDLSDLVGFPITLADESISTNSEDMKYINREMSIDYVIENRDFNIYDVNYECDESCTWTFYRLATVKGYVDIRWLGNSNGYYSESVDFICNDISH